MSAAVDSPMATTSTAPPSDPPPPPEEAPVPEEVVITEDVVEVELESQEEPFEWSLKDQVALLNTVAIHGTENWAPIDETMAEYADAVVEMERDEDEPIWRPDDWFLHDSCFAEYNRLLEVHKTEPLQEGETLTDAILRKLEDARADELDAELEREALEYKAGLEDIRRMEAGEYGHIMEVVGENEAFKRFMVEEGLGDQLDEALESYYQWQDMTPEEREAAAAAQAEADAEAAAQAAAAAEPLQIETEGTTMAPPPLTPAAGGPSSPKVSPQLKNLVYTAIAGTQEDPGNLPAPASSPTLSMLLEMPPRGHGQPLPEIPTVVPQKEAAAAAEGGAETILPDGGEQRQEMDMERDIDLKIEGNVQISPQKRTESEEADEEGAAEGKEVDPLLVTIDISESPPKTSTSPTKTGIVTLEKLPITINTSAAAAEGSTSETPVAKGTAAPGRTTRRTAATSSEPATADEGKSLRGRTIVTTPTKETQDAQQPPKDKEKVRVKLEFDASTKTLKNPTTEVGFKTVAMKEKEKESSEGEKRDLRSRRSFGPGSGTPKTPPASAAGQTPPPVATTTKKEAHDQVVEKPPSGGEESAARATERWVEGAGTVPPKPQLTPAPTAASAPTAEGGTPAAAGVRKRRGDSSEERGAAEEKEGEDKRITRARTKTPATPAASASSRGASPAAAAAVGMVKTTMTPPPSLTPAPGIKEGAQRATTTPGARATPEPESSASRALRSRPRLPDSFSFSGTDPSSPAAPYSTPHSPASSTTTSMFEDHTPLSSLGEYKNMKRALLSLHRLVTQLKNAYIFLKPTALPRYSKPRFDEFVLHPLDLTTIKKNIEADSVRTFEQYQQQMCIMFMNHLMYFNEGTDLYRQAKEMATETFDIVEDFIRNYKENNAAGQSSSGGGAGGGSKRESRARDLRHSYSTTSAGASASKKGTPTPSVAESGQGKSRSVSEDSHGGAEGHRMEGRGGGGAGRGRGRGRKKRIDLSPSITDEPRKGLTRTPRAPPPPTASTKTRQSGA